MELDIILEADLNSREVRELGLLAEEYGFRAVWTQNYARARDAFMIAMPLALASKRIRVGVLAVSAYEMHPLKIANALLTLNECAPAGACVVVGAGGEWPLILNVGYGKRITGTREALQLIKDAASGETVTSEGEIYNALGFHAAWSMGAEAAPQIYAGSTGPKMLTMAAGVADGAMMSDMQPEMFDWSMPALRTAVAEQGCEDFRISNFLAWHVKEDREASVHEARRELMLRGFLDRKWLEPYLSPEDVDLVANNIWPFLNAFRNKSSEIEGVPDPVVDALVEGLSLAGDYSDIDRHIERLRKFEDAGFTEIALRIHDDPEDSIRLIGQRVLREFQ
jgi:alkanesulfonate monooxygenase SsuD/methylene tetrahydromethanopterin reductase-like flavin-dependent oxidoreductase (luciferase family)